MYKNNPLDAPPPPSVHNIDETRQEGHFKKSIPYVKVGYGFA